MVRHFLSVVLVSLLFNTVALSKQVVRIRKLPKDFKIILNESGDQIIYRGKLLTISNAEGKVIAGTTSLAKVGERDTVIFIDKVDTVLNVIRITKPEFDLIFDGPGQHPSNIGAFFQADVPRRIYVKVRGLNWKEDSLTRIELVEATFCYVNQDDTLEKEFRINSDGGIKAMLESIRRTVRPGDTIYVDHIEILLNGELYKEDGNYWGFYMK